MMMTKELWCLDRTDHEYCISSLFNRGATFVARHARIEGALPISYTMVPSNHGFFMIDCIALKMRGYKTRVFIKIESGY